MSSGPLWVYYGKVYLSMKFRKLLTMELWIVKDIVSKFDAPMQPLNDALICPGNKNLHGAKYPYFPVGGPVPSLIELSNKSMRSSYWCGMSAGIGMRYPTQCIDGRVHVEGGLSLKKVLSEYLQSHSIPCLGDAFITEATERLLIDYSYKYIIHTVPPLKNDFISLEKFDSIGAYGALVSCYENSIRNAFLHAEIRTCATALIGAGTAGFDEKESIDSLKLSISKVLDSLLLSGFNQNGRLGDPKHLTLRIVLQSAESAKSLLTELNDSFH